MTRCICGHLSDAHNTSNGVCLWRDCYCMAFTPTSEEPQSKRAPEGTHCPSCDGHACPDV